MISVDNRDALAGLEQTKRAASATGEAIGNIFAIAGISFGAAALVAYAKQVSDVGVAAESAEVRLKSLAGRFGEAEQAQRAAANAAELLNLSQTEASSGFAQLFASLRPTGVSLQQIETIFVGVTAAAKNTGLSAESVNNALIQLTQGLASGRLQGDELRSVLEQLPPLSQAIAKELNVPVGALKQLGSEGKISTEIIIKALERLKGQEVGQLSKALNTSQEKLKTLSVEAQNFQKELSTAFGAPALATVGALTNAFKGLAGAIRAANIANQNKEFTLQADKKAGNLVQAAIGPLGGSGFFGGVSITYKGKTYKGTATGVKNDLAKAILTDLINELSNTGGGGGGSPTPTPTAAVDPKIKGAVDASQKRLDNLVKLRGLEGSVLELMKAQLAVQDSVTEQRRLQAEYDIAAGKARKAGKDPSADQAAVDAQAKLKAATIELNSRQIEFADTQERINRAKQEEIRLTEDRIAKAQRSLGVDQATADVRDRLAEIDKRRFEAEVTGRGAVLEDYFNKREESQIRRDPNAKARIDAAKARLAEQGFVDYGPQLVADAKLAGANFKAALLEGADYFSKTIKGATASLEGSFQYLTPKFQDIVLDSARKDIAAAQKAGIFRGDVTFGAKPEDIIGIAGSARSALAAGQQLMSATEGLNAVMKDLTSPLMGLVNKDWRVIVNVAADGQPTVSGDVLGGVA
jgi:tape measure domain-containing protein